MTHDNDDASAVFALLSSGSDNDDSLEKPKGPTELYKEFKFDEDISLGRIFPSLKGTRFDAFTMKNTSMIWLGKDASAIKRAGLWFETDVEFSGLLQPAADVLSDVFGQEKPGIHLSAHLGIQKEWNDELIATGFTFRGSIEGINRGFGELMMFRNAGLMISIVPAGLGETKTIWGFYGTLHLNIPNSAVPLVLDYKLDPNPDTLDISMGFGTGERWLSVFGVAGLNVSRATILTNLASTTRSADESCSLTKLVSRQASQKLTSRNRWYFPLLHNGRLGTFLLI